MTTQERTIEDLAIEFARVTGAIASANLARILLERAAGLLEEQPHNTELRALLNRGRAFLSSFGSDIMTAASNATAAANRARACVERDTQQPRGTVALDVSSTLRRALLDAATRAGDHADRAVNLTRRLYDLQVAYQIDNHAAYAANLADLCATLQQSRANLANAFATQEQSLFEQSAYDQTLSGLLDDISIEGAPSIAVALEEQTQRAANLAKSNLSATRAALFQQRDRAAACLAAQQSYLDHNRARALYRDLQTLCARVGAKDNAHAAAVHTATKQAKIALDNAATYAFAAADLAQIDHIRRGLLLLYPHLGQPLRVAI